MAKLRTKLAQFFYKHRNAGVPRLMLWVGIANVIVYVLYLVKPEDPMFTRLLCFDPYAVAQGEVWRMLSYPLVYLAESSGPILGILSLLFFYWIGLVLEQLWGTLRMNLYYLTGVLLTALASLLTKTYCSAIYVNLSLILAMAVLQPDEMIRLYFVIPVKMKWLAWIELGVTLIAVIRGLIVMFLSLGNSLYLGWIVPLMPVAVFLLFFGKQAAALLPDFIRYHPTRKSWKRKVKQGRIYEVPNRQGQARFRCTVCGRTELTNPGLEFRYCSRCAGYRCYCEDHIHNHEHITEP
ncbi:MAG: rhomboid family intramembrane serine protease [Oscillospiraceae bacterium]|nr:rhomboid family intramembrane serine protease [Oscillospiraceae bacterium]